MQGDAMKGITRLHSGIGLVLAAFLILSCTFSVEVLPTETPVPATFTPDLPDDLPTATFTERGVSAQDTNWFSGGDLP